MILAPREAIDTNAPLTQHPSIWRCFFVDGGLHVTLSINTQFATTHAQSHLPSPSNRARARAIRPGASMAAGALSVFWVAASGAAPCASMSIVVDSMVLLWYRWSLHVGRGSLI